ncbi:MAG: DUF6580 family putative transport protein [Candidatus Omnitrophota bacterium]
MLGFFLLLFGVMMRLIVHPANFTPVLALILFGGVYCNKKYALFLPLLLMMVSDAILGVHSLILFTWGSLMLIALIGLWLRERRDWLHLTAASFGAAVLFYVVTNFGVWLLGYYPMNLKGLVDCYVLAIPFFRTMLVSTLVYSFVFFGLYELVASRVKNTRYAHVL